MKLLHVSDLHFHENWLLTVRGIAPTFDAVAITGDLVNVWYTRHGRYSYAQQANYLKNYFSEFPRPVFLCTGDHERELDPDAVPSFMREAAQNNKHVRIDGCNEVFMGRRFICVPYMRDAPIEPPPLMEPVVVLVHTPPAETQVSTGHEDLGDHHVATLADSLPRDSIVLCGHQHRPARWHDPLPGVHCFNPGYTEVCAEPRTIELDLKRRLANFCDLHRIEY